MREKKTGDNLQLIILLNENFSFHHSTLRSIPLSVTVRWISDLAIIQYKHLKV